MIILQGGGNLKDRLKELRKELGLTQEKFAERLSMKRNTIATYEIGRNEPIDAVIALICREFNVNETWLRTGEGEIFNPLTRAFLIANKSFLHIGKDGHLKVKYSHTPTNNTFVVPIFYYLPFSQYCFTDFCLLF